MALILRVLAYRLHGLVLLEPSLIYRRLILDIVAAAFLDFLAKCGFSEALVDYSALFVHLIFAPVSEVAAVGTVLVVRI